MNAQIGHNQKVLSSEQITSLSLSDVPIRIKLKRVLSLEWEQTRMRILQQQQQQIL